MDMKEEDEGDGVLAKASKQEESKKMGVIVGLDKTWILEIIPQIKEVSVELRILFC